MYYIIHLSFTAADQAEESRVATELHVLVQGSPNNCQLCTYTVDGSINNECSAA